MPLGPRLTRGQELVFRGTFTEEARNQGVQFNRSYRLEARAFVLEANRLGSDVALLTVWRGRSGAGTATPANTEVGTARIDLVRIDPRGRVAGRENLTVPLDGPPPSECGAFVEEPAAHIRSEQRWEVAESGRPVHDWRVAGSEVVNGARCAKLVGVQQSDDWDKPRADRTAWRRTDTVWITPRGGYACVVERVIERREPAHTEPTQKSVLHYELESALLYQGQIYDDRKREIEQAQSFAEAVAALLPHAGQNGPHAFEVVLKRIADYYDRQPPTPYREAIRYAQRLAEGGKRGEVPPEAHDNAAPVAQVLDLGKPAPDFLALDLVAKESVSLHRWLGKPIVLVFYNPKAASAVEVLHFAQQVQQIHGERVAVLGMAVSDNYEQALRQREEMDLKFPILSGTGLRLSYKVESTPKLVVLDSAGMMRGSYDGWGPEIPHSVNQDLTRCLAIPR
jgi:peroxiredoxin